MVELQERQLSDSPYAQVFKNASSIIKDTPSSTILLKTLNPTKRNEHQYNRPSANEVAAVIQGHQDIGHDPRQFLIRSKSSVRRPAIDLSGQIVEDTAATPHLRMNRSASHMQTICELHTAYFPLRYPVIFWYGQQGPDSHYISPTAGATGKSNVFHLEIL